LTEFWWNLTPLGLVFATLLCLNLLSTQFHGRDDAVHM
jgi:ABC-type dipeptide/oligopeptide/nickel transport system permease subunit